MKCLNNDFNYLQGGTIYQTLAILLLILMASIGFWKMCLILSAVILITGWTLR